MLDVSQLAAAMPKRIDISDVTVQHARGSWAAWYNTWLLIELTPKGVVFSFLFFHARG